MPLTTSRPRAGAIVTEEPLSLEVLPRKRLGTRVEQVEYTIKPMQDGPLGQACPRTYTRCRRLARPEPAQTKANHPSMYTTIIMLYPLLAAQAGEKEIVEFPCFDKAIRCKGADLRDRPVTPQLPHVL